MKKFLTATVTTALAAVALTGCSLGTGTVNQNDVLSSSQTVHRSAKVYNQDGSATRRIVIKTPSGKHYPCTLTYKAGNEGTEADDVSCNLDHDLGHDGN